MEDSFCVREDDENETKLSDDDDDNDIVNFNLIGENERRLRTRKAEKEIGKNYLCKKKKRSRIISLDDSSDEELDTNVKCQLAGTVLIQNSKSKQATEDKSVTLCTSKPSLGGTFKKPISNKNLHVAEIGKSKPLDLCSLERSCDTRTYLQACDSETLDFHVEQKQSRCTSIPPPQVKYTTTQDKTEMKSHTHKLTCDPFVSIVE